VSDITDIAITEQRPDITNKELKEYVLINTEETALYTIGSPEEEYKIPKEYQEF
jgi:hypothetical protein